MHFLEVCMGKEGYGRRDGPRTRTAFFVCMRDEGGVKGEGGHGHTRIPGGHLALVLFKPTHNVLTASEEAR